MNKKKWICHGFQILFGLIIILSGTNKFFAFIPIPYEGLAGEVMAGLEKAGYLMPLVAILEIGIGIMLVLNKLTPIAVLLLAPLSVNFVGFHLALDIAGIAPAAFIFVVNAYYIFLHRNKYIVLLQTREKLRA
jgi:uncharacterized membrane protein YphA (DoxX/SURF4 family)